MFENTCNQIKWTDVEQEFSELFKPDLGSLKNARVKLYIKHNITPRSMKVNHNGPKKGVGISKHLVANSFIKTFFFLRMDFHYRPCLKKKRIVKSGYVVTLN